MFFLSLVDLLIFGVNVFLIDLIDLIKDEALELGVGGAGCSVSAGGDLIDEAAEVSDSSKSLPILVLLELLLDGNDDFLICFSSLLLSLRFLASICSISQSVRLVRGIHLSTANPFYCNLFSISFLVSNLRQMLRGVPMCF